MKGEVGSHVVAKCSLKQISCPCGCIRRSDISSPAPKSFNDNPMGSDVGEKFNILLVVSFVENIISTPSCGPCHCLHKSNSYLMIRVRMSALCS